MRGLLYLQWEGFCIREPTDFQKRKGFHNCKLWKLSHICKPSDLQKWERFRICKIWDLQKWDGFHNCKLARMKVVSYLQAVASDTILLANTKAPSYLQAIGLAEMREISYLHDVGLAKMRGVSKLQAGKNGRAFIVASRRTCKYETGFIIASLQIWKPSHIYKPSGWLHTRERWGGCHRFFNTEARSYFEVWESFCICKPQFLQIWESFCTCKILDLQQWDGFHNCNLAKMKAISYLQAVALDTILPANTKASPHLQAIRLAKKREISYLQDVGLAKWEGFYNCKQAKMGGPSNLQAVGLANTRGVT